MKADRRSLYLHLARKLLDRLGFRCSALEPAASGRKGLVFFCHPDRGEPLVMRLYSNPLYYFKSLLIRRAVARARVPLAPEVVFSSLLFSGARPWGVVLEERLGEVSSFGRDQALDLVRRLALLHRNTSISSKLLHRYVLAKWIRKTEGSLRYIKKAGDIYHTLKPLWDRVCRMEVGPLLSLCHRDVGLANSGTKGDRLLLLDWDNASLFFPQYEFIQCCYFFGLSPEDALPVYLEASGWKDCFTDSLPFFVAMFLIARAKKYLRRGKLYKLDRICYLASQWEVLA